MLVRLIAGPEAKNANFSHYFLAMNRGKRSITLDLKKPEAKEILLFITGALIDGTSIVGSDVAFLAGGSPCS